MATPDMAACMRQVPWPDDIDGRGGLGAWLVRLLDPTPAPRALLTSHLASSPHPATRRSACRALLELAQQWRSATNHAVAALTDRLADPDPEVARIAACYLARVGDTTSTVADRLAAALGHEDTEVHAWIVVALAHCGDPRAVTPLASLLGQVRCPWPEHPSWAEDSHAPHQLLDALHPHAAQLLPAISDLLDRGGEGWAGVAQDLVRSLSAWGEQAAGAVPAVMRLLLRGPCDTETIVTTLARIGAPAEAAAPALDLLAADDERHNATLAWAYWRITGQRTEATTATLTRLAGTPPHGPNALRLLADLGPAATASADTIRTLLGDRNEAVRVQAARTLWRVTGNLPDTLPVLLHAVRRSSAPGRLWPIHVEAVDYLGAIGAPAAAAIPALEAFLHRDHRGDDVMWSYDPIGWDQHCQHVAARALARISA
jgi:hypothetical protein